MPNGLTFPQPRNPDFDGASLTPKVKVLETNFGDGYTHRMPDGINSIQDNWSLKWGLLTSEEASIMSSFCRQQMGVYWFYWLAPGDSVAKKWTCNTWSRGFGDAVNNDTFSATFAECFDP